MEMTRKEFLGSIAGATAFAAASPTIGTASAAGASKKANIRRGVSLYSYIGDFQSDMTLEDCFMEMDDMGARGLEILSEAHIPDYPNPSNAWIDHWYKMLEKYQITPAFYSSWLEDTTTPDETLEHMLRDMQLARKLGFKRMRPKVAGARTQPAPGTRVGPGFGSNIDPKWEEWVSRALPYAEKLDVKFAPEIHEPTTLNSQVVQDIVAFCQKTQTQHFGLQIDTGIFSTRRARLGDSDFESEPDPEREKRFMAMMAGQGGMPRMVPSQPKELLQVLPYTIHFHFKFWEMLEDLTEYSIPFDGIIAALKEGGYDGWVCSEYEGPRTQGLASLQLRRQHIMLKRLLGEYPSA
jgi:sugar phosphate isomerase/epimerase